MKMPQLSFFDAEKRYEKLTELGGSFEKLDSIMEWKMFSKMIKNYGVNDAALHDRSA